MHVHGDKVAGTERCHRTSHGAVGKGGILRDEEVRRRVIDECAAGIAALGLIALGVFDSPVAGTGGNREAFALFRREGA